uniref:DOMON domain-containing protein n=1 Tax=Anopheles coluzzii TaxID=1518534 RepID=A0A8W7Q2B5_ANOCL
MAFCVRKAREPCFGPLANYKQPAGRLAAAAAPPARLLLLLSTMLLMLPAAHGMGLAATVPSKIEPVHHRWTRSEAMDPNGLYTLDWHIDQKDIVFTATANTRGFMGLGFSHRSEHMAGSDLVLVWVDDRTGKPNVLCPRARNEPRGDPVAARDSGSGRGTQVEPCEGLSSEAGQ